MENLIYEKRLLVKGPKIVVVGGGTGLSTMLRGLKYYTSNITAIVTVADDGGGSGALREDLGMLPPGDIRNCILALADTEPLMEELLQYRFTDGRLKNQSFGNLFLAAMDGVSENFEDAVQKMSSVLAVTGKVLPVTLEDMKLVAELENGNVIEGESQIPEEAIKQNSRIKKLMIEPRDAKPLQDAIRAIEEADAIVLGPGSLYTSIIPNLLVKDIADSIRKSDAIKIYISNIMTQPGETHGFKASDHIKVLKKYGGRGIVDYVIANRGDIPSHIKERYLKEYELSEKDANIITASKYLSDLFESAIKVCNNPKAVNNWIISDISRILNETEMEPIAIPFDGNQLGKLVILIDKGTISSSIGKKVLTELFENPRDPEDIIKEKGWIQISDEGAIKEVVSRILEANPQSIADYKAGKDRALGFLVGQAMKETKGKANPKMLNEMFLAELNK